MKNEENKNERFEKSKEAWGDIWKKTKEVSKKTAQKAQEEAKKIAEQMEQKKQEQAEQKAQKRQERDFKKYNPLTEEDYRCDDFRIPNIIEIVDDAVRRDVEICEGAIGWREKHKEVEVFHLYDEFVPKSGLTFIPSWQVDNVYCVDVFDKTKFINVNYIFGKTVEEKIAELEHVAYCLGAKSCSVEIVENDAQSQASAKSANTQLAKIKSQAEISASTKSLNKQSGKTISYFEGNRDPIQPTLKWFANDDNITHLIQMRCSGNNAIKAKVLELKGSASTTMSQKTAIAIDCVLGKRLKGGFSAESQVSKEQSRVLIFEVEF